MSRLIFQNIRHILNTIISKIHKSNPMRLAFLFTTYKVYEPVYSIFWSWFLGGAKYFFKSNTIELIVHCSMWVEGWGMGSAEKKRGKI